MDVLKNQGFEIVKNVVDPGVISSLIQAVEASTVARSRAGMRHAMEVEEVSKLAWGPQLLNIAKKNLGENATPFRATLFDKSPKSNWLVVWHQDTALPFRERQEVPGWGPWSVKEGVNCAHSPSCALEQVLAIRVHLDDSTGDNGSLRVLPATHKLGVLSDDSIHHLTTTISAVECLVPSGGILLMKPLLAHASSKVTRGRRRVLHIEYTSQCHFAGRLDILVQGQQHQ